MPIFRHRETFLKVETILQSLTVIMRKRRGYVRWVVVAALVLGAAGAAYFVLAALRPTVTVTEVVDRRVVQAFYATGTVSPEREYPIRTPSAGLLVEVLVDKGDAVKSGQPLAKVSDPDLDMKVKQAEAEVAERAARADPKNSPVVREYDAKVGFTNEMVGIAQREEQRLSRLVGTSAATQGDVDRATDHVKEMSMQLANWQAQRDAKLLELQKELEMSKASLAAARENVRRLTLLAPLDGVVLDRPTAKGTRLAVNDQVMRVADVRPDKLVMRAQVDEEDITKVRVDKDHPQLVQMSLYAFSPRPGERQVAQLVFEGQVLRKYDQADPDRRTFEVDVSLPTTEARFQPGMTGELAFIMQSKDSAPVVPAQAVQDGSLFVVRDHRLTRADEAKLGVGGVERVEVVSGLRPGDRVVVSPVAGMKLGQTVREKYMDPDAAAGVNKPKAKEIFRGGF
jgi:RND family efflux transporter MFP subunit